MSKSSAPRTSPSFAALVQSFFTEHLTQQRAMSPRTVATYRDGFVLFLDFATAQMRKQPTAMKLQDITPMLILFSGGTTLATAELSCKTTPQASLSAAIVAVNLL